MLMVRRTLYLEAAMRILLVSSNPLFAEILSHTLRDATGSEASQIAPQFAPEYIRLQRPQLIVLDENSFSDCELSELLAGARTLPDSHTLLLNRQNNDITIISAHRATIRKVEDMAKVIHMVEEEQRNGNGSALAAECPAAAAAARAGAYGFLALLCNQRPSLELVRRLRTIGVEGFLGMVDGEPDNDLIRQGLEEMAAFVAEAGNRSDAEVEELLAVDWTRLFRGVRPGYGPPPPYEGVYLGADPLQAIQAVSSVYRQHGVAPASDSSANRPDYIGIELDFLRYLCEQQVAAHEKGDEEAIEQWSRAEAAFLQNHLGKWASAYCDRAAQEAATAFYRGTAHLISALLKVMSTGFGQSSDQKLFIHGGHHG
jgi:putative dimethyl sulfoxide reductase chaperone